MSEKRHSKIDRTGAKIFLTKERKILLLDWLEILFHIRLIGMNWALEFWKTRKQVQE